MKLATYDIVFQEVPGETSLAFYIMGCPLSCDGCHSELLWGKKGGETLSKELFLRILSKYNTMVTCILFMGGEWHKEDLVSLLKLSKDMGYSTALYTGEESTSKDIEDNLDYLKTGKFIKKLGGLSSKTTNQQFIKLTTDENLNHLFHS